MQKSPIFLTILLIFLGLTTPAPVFAKKDKAPWTIFIYMEHSGDLADAAINNLNDMAKIGPGKANVLVMLHTRGQEAWLYKIKKNKIVQKEQMHHGDDVAENIINGMERVVTKYPAEKYGVVLWDHGFGIIVPRYNPETEEWEVEPDGQEECDCPIKRYSANSYACHQKHHRGMLINSDTQTCMNNEHMVRVFEHISKNLLGGKKIDFCGLDMCKGAMLEHAYQLRNYVHYIIGSQECELRDGWPYDLIFQVLSEHPSIAPRELVTTVISSYEEYYLQNAPLGRYTQSALDCSYAEILKSNLDAIVHWVDSCPAKLASVMPDILHSARKRNIKICDAPAYADLHKFYTDLLDEINDYEDVFGVHQEFEQLKSLLSSGCTIIQNMVVANTTGFAVTEAQGVSIYFPQHHIDSSYIDTDFAQNSAWLSFLKKIIT